MEKLSAAEVEQWREKIRPDVMARGKPLIDYFNNDCVQCTNDLPDSISFMPKTSACPVTTQQMTVLARQMGLHSPGRYLTVAGASKINGLLVLGLNPTEATGNTIWSPHDPVEGMPELSTENVPKPRIDGLSWLRAHAIGSPVPPVCPPRG